MKALNTVEQLILDRLKSEHRALSAYDLLDLLREHGIKSPPLIYRGLKTLLTQRKVHRIESLNSYIACCQSCTHSHYFLLCTKCKSITEWHNQQIEEEITNMVRKHNFLLQESVVEIFGICNLCKDTNKK